MRRNLAVTVLLLLGITMPMMSEGAREQTGPARKRSWKVGMLHARTDEHRRVRDPLTAVVKAIREHPKLDVLLGPEWLFAPSGALHTAGEFEAIRDAVQRESAGKSMLIVPGTVARSNAKGLYENTALAFSDGRLLKAYSKRTAGGDHRLAASCRTRWQPGTEDSLLSWEHRGSTYSVGLEICFDHADGRLVNDVASTKPVQPVDIQLVPACGWGRTDPNVAIGPGGLFVCNNGFKRTDLDVRRFAAINPGDPVTAVPPADGWSSSQIAWRKGRAGKPIPLTDEVELIVYSVPAPTSRARSK